MEGRRPEASDWAATLASGLNVVLQNYPLQLWAQWNAGVYPGVWDDTDDSMQGLGHYEVLMLAARRLLEDAQDAWRTEAERDRFMYDARQRFVDASAVAEHGADIDRIVHAEAGILISCLFTGAQNDVVKSISRIERAAGVGLSHATAAVRSEYAEMLAFARSFSTDPSESARSGTKTAAYLGLSNTAADINREIDILVKAFEIEVLGDAEASRQRGAARTGGPPKSTAATAKLPQSQGRRPLKRKR